MIKSELVQRLAARNPHLYQRDIEHIVDAILGEITDALARGVDLLEENGTNGRRKVRHRRQCSPDVARHRANTGNTCT